jgi:hypothetical protein
VGAWRATAYYESLAAGVRKWNPVNFVNRMEHPRSWGGSPAKKDFRVTSRKESLRLHPRFSARASPHGWWCSPKTRESLVLKPQESQQWYGEVLGWMKLVDRFGAALG